MSYEWLWRRPTIKIKQMDPEEVEKLSVTGEIGDDDPTPKRTVKKKRKKISMQNIHLGFKVPDDQKVTERMMNRAKSPEFLNPLGKQFLTGRLRSLTSENKINLKFKVNKDAGENRDVSPNDHLD